MVEYANLSLRNMQISRVAIQLSDSHIVSSLNDDLMTFYMWAYMQILNLVTYMAHDVAK